MNHTLTHQSPIFNAVAIHFRHGQDLCILGLSRSRCRNRNQLRGYDQMRAYIDGHAKCTAETRNPDCPELADWAAELQQRRDEAWDRRAWSRLLNVQTAEVMAAMEADAMSPPGDTATGHTCAICSNAIDANHEYGRIGTDTYAHEVCLEDEADKTMYNAPGYAETPGRW